MKDVWEEFGELADVWQKDGNLCIKNSEGEERKMSIEKYKEAAAEVERKLSNMMHHDITIKISKNTGAWNKLAWFSDVRLSA